MRSSLALLLVLSVAACGDDDGSPPPDGGGGGDGAVDGSPGDGGTDDGALDAGPGDASLDASGDGGDAGARPTSIDALRAAYCEPLARVDCSARWACGCSGDRPPPDLEACVTTAIESCMTELEGRLGAYVREGRLTIDPAALEECGRRIEASYGACSATLADVADWCAPMLLENVAIGEACFVTRAVCAGGLGSCATGTCTSLPREGMACTGLCASRLACRGGTCVARSPSGGACERDAHCTGDDLCVFAVCTSARVPLGSACDTAAQCVAGAACVGSVCTEATLYQPCTTSDSCPSLTECEARLGRVCRDPSMLGAACRTHVECGEGAYCDESVSPPACALRGGAGVPCPYGEDQCMRGMICDTRVVPPVCASPGALGASCAIGSGPGVDGCEPGLSCVAGTCATPPTDGQPCADDGECAEGLACRLDATTGASRCASLGLSGETCTSLGWQNECAAGLYCDPATTTCTSRRTLGDPCSGASYECDEGLTCLLGDDRSGTCSAIPAEGERCTDACGTGLVCAEGALPPACTPRVCSELYTGEPMPPPR